jgi:hypothetical protein
MCVLDRFRNGAYTSAVELGRLGFVIGLFLLAAPLAAEAQTARKRTRALGLIQKL